MTEFYGRDVEQNQGVIIAHIHTGTFLIIQGRPDVSDIHLIFLGNQGSFLQGGVHQIHPASRPEIINLAKDIILCNISSYQWVFFVHRSLRGNE